MTSRADGRRSPSRRSDRRAALTAYAADRGIELVFFDPPAHFDHAIVGLVHGFNQEVAVLYDQAQVLAALEADGMSPDEAEEWFAYNTIGAYVGEATPRFLIETGEDADG
jgi:hypothetical protein